MKSAMHPEAREEFLAAIDYYNNVERRFPYAILYSKEANRVFIYAIMHTKRKPGYWYDRLNA